MSQIDISADLIGFITGELLNDRPGVSVTADDDLLASGLIDSLGVMRLIQFIEKTWNVTVPPADVTIEHFGQVSTIEAYLRGRGL